MVGCIAKSRYTVILSEFNIQILNHFRFDSKKDTVKEASASINTTDLRVKLSQSASAHMR